MAYTPTNHTVSNKSYAVTQPIPVDAKAYYDDGIKQRVYASTAEVIAEVTGIDRRGHTLFVVNTGGTESGGIITGGTNELWYFKDAYADSDLVRLVQPFPTIPAAQVNSDWNASSGLAQILNKPTIPAAQVNADWNASSGVSQILNKPTIPAAAPVYTSDNAVTKTGTNFQLGGTMIKDTVLAGNFDFQISEGRIGIGMNPVFPLDIFNNWANLGAQLTSQLGLSNGSARLGMLSAMQIFGSSPFTHSSIDQVSGKTGQLTFYNSAAHTLNTSSCYSGSTGILIGYATAAITNGILSAIAAITYFGKTGTYTEACGLRITTPVGMNFIDATDFAGTVTNFYYILLDAFNPASWSGTMTNRYGIYQKGSDPHRLGGKIVWDATITTPGTTGAQTINKPAGTVNIAAGGGSVVVTNSMVTTSSLVMVQLRTNDSTAKSAIAIESNGSFTITLNAACTNEVAVKFWVTN